jgi:beta-carotene hydroxylase
MIGVVAVWLVLVPVYFFIAICVHDAVHRSAHSNPTLNAVVGWTGAALHGMNFAMLRRQHLLHHSHLGQKSDEETYVYRSAWTLPLRLLTVHLFCFLTLVKAPKREQWQGVAFLASCGIGLAYFPAELFWGWCLPMLTSNAAFTWASVYLPHGPLGNWVHRNVPQLTGYHEEHHAVPQLPWYQVASVARRHRCFEAKV